MRYAIYFTPGETDPLTRAAERWIGRSAFSDAVPAPLDADLAFHTASARRYGFHATMKAPFRLLRAAAKPNSSMPSTAGPPRRASLCRSAPRHRPDRRFLRPRAGSRSADIELSRAI